MQNFIIKIVTSLIIIIGILFIYIVKKKKKNNLIINDTFWIFISWGGSLACYCFFGLSYPIELSLNVFGYILLCWLCYFLGKGVYKIFPKKQNIMLENNSNIVEPEVRFDIKYNLFPYFVISLISVILYVSYILLINRNIVLGTTRNINTNFIATLLLLMSQSSLIIWLYELLYAILNKKKITWYGLLSVIIYNLPGIIISGRDALIIFFLSSFIAIIYGINYLKYSKKTNKKLRKKMIRMAIVVIIIILFYLIFLSNNRYGNDYDAVINMFSWASGVTFPDYLIKFYNYAGGVGKLVLNIIFYYSSQFSKLALVFNNYNGPYEYGFYQLHYIARMLPDSWNLGLTPVSIELSNIVNNVSLPGIKVLWETMIGYSLYDFGKIGTLIYFFIIGFIIQRIIVKNSYNVNILKIITRIFICVAMFITVEISPFFDYFYVFPLIWLIIIKNMKGKVKK